MPDIARRHHFLPEFFLSGFTPSGSRDDFLNVFDLENKRRWQVKPIKAGAERDFNTVEVVGLSPDVIEQGLSDFENHVAKILTWIEANEAIPEEEDLIYLLNFVALLHVRNPASRNTINEALGQLGKVTMQLATSNKDVWDNMMAKSGALNKYGPVDYEKARRYAMEAEVKANQLKHS